MSSRKALVILLVSTALPKITLVYLIGGCSALAPDERGYLGVFSNIYGGQGSRSTLVWTQTPGWVLKILFAPAGIFQYLGFSGLTSIRLSAVLLSECSAVILFLTLQKASIQFNKKKLIFLISTLLIPSFVLWSSSGLRESFLYISLAGCFYSVISFMKEKHSFKYLYLLLYLVSSFALSYTKAYLSVIFACSILLGGLLIYKKSELKSNVVILTLSTIIILACAPGASYLFQVPKFSFSITGFFHKHEYSGPTSSSALSKTLQELENCRRQNTGGPLMKFLSDKIPAREMNAQLPLKSGALGATGLQQTASSDPINRNVINFPRLPGGIFTFLLVPISFNSLGLVGSYGVVESLFWLPLYFILILSLVSIRRAKLLIPLEATLIAPFVVIFTIFSGAVEINYGTALRHRSLLLIPILLIIFVLREKLNSVKCQHGEGNLQN